MAATPNVEVTSIICSVLLHNKEEKEVWVGSDT
jgi:hypothetical protein